MSQYAGHGSSLVRSAAEAGQPLRVYACGGDGTLNEVVCGAVGYPNVAVTHFPGGSGNDFVKLFDDPAAFGDLTRLLDCEEAQFDLMQCRTQAGQPPAYALNVLSIGVDARIGTSIHKYKRLPFITGSGAYLVSTLVNVIKGIHQHYTIELGGMVLDGRKTLIYVANGRYYGGGFHPIPDADPADGYLDVLIVDAVSRFRAAAVIGDYKNGLYAKHPDLIHRYRCKEITIHCDGPSEINLDGELLFGQDVTFSLAPEKLRFFYPSRLSWRKTPAAAAKASNFPEF